MVGGDAWASSFHLISSTITHNHLRYPGYDGPELDTRHAERNQGYCDARSGQWYCQMLAMVDSSHDQVMILGRATIKRARHSLESVGPDPGSPFRPSIYYLKLVITYLIYINRSS